MSKTYIQVVKQIESLKVEAEKLRRKEISGVVEKIRQAIATYQLSAADLGFTQPASKSGTGRGRRKVHTEIRYRDAAGQVWGGRGPRPRWLREALNAGKALQDFEVKA